MLFQVPVIIQRGFHDFPSSIGTLSPEQVAAFRRALDSVTPATAAAGESVFDVMSRAGLIGCLKGRPDSPRDLSTNPQHMEGLARG